MRVAELPAASKTVTVTVDVASLGSAGGVMRTTPPENADGADAPLTVAVERVTPVLSAAATVISGEVVVTVEPSAGVGDPIVGGIWILKDQRSVKGVPATSLTVATTL